jgi:hypothetical protein
MTVHSSDSPIFLTKPKFLSLAHSTALSGQNSSSVRSNTAKSIYMPQTSKREVGERMSPQTTFEVVSSKFLETCDGLITKRKNVGGGRDL